MIIIIMVAMIMRRVLMMAITCWLSLAQTHHQCGCSSKKLMKHYICVSFKVNHLILQQINNCSF